MQPAGASGSWCSCVDDSVETYPLHLRLSGWYASFQDPISSEATTTVESSSSGTDDQQGLSLFWDQIRERFSRPPSGAENSGRQGPRTVAITVCVLISALLWFIFTVRESYTAVIEFPTQVTNLPQDEALLERPPRTVEAQVNAPGATLLYQWYRPFTVSLDGSRERVNVLEMMPDLPGDGRVETVSPQVVSLEKGPRVTEAIPIRLRGKIPTPPTHELLDEPELDPDSLLVSGAKSVVESIRYWPTERISPSPIKDSLVMRVDLADTLAGLVEHSVNRITLRAQARQFTEGERMIEVHVSGAPSGAGVEVVRLEREKVRVRYRVLFSQYREAQNAPDFFARVPYEEIRADTTGRIRPEPHYPDGVVLRDVELIPSTLRYYNVLPSE